MLKNAPGYVDFRATATHFVNIFVFLLIFEISGDPEGPKKDFLLWGPGEFFI